VFDWAAPPTFSDGYSDPRVNVVAMAHHISVLARSHHLPQ
jgi:hypothetical protein